MASIFDEKFEGAGYEEAGASETVGAGCTIDEDADSADVSSPSGWGSQCLKFISLSGITNKVEWSDFGPKVISFYRFEVVITAESLANSQDNTLFIVADSGWATAFNMIFHQDGIGNLKFILNSFHDGNYHSYIGFPTISLDTRYRIEIKWDATNDHWAWKIDGVSQPNDQDASSPVTTEGNLTGTHPTDCDQLVVGNWDASNDADVTHYYDLIAIDDADWVGSESSGTNIKINIGDVLKDVSEIKININDVLKNVVEVKQNIGDVLKVVF